MAFGQPTGPAAGRSQMTELLGLLQEAGFEGYRDARGPMGFSQRQGNGKFTGDEADAYIAQLYEEAEQRDAESAPPSLPSPAVPKATARPKLSAAERAARQLTDEQLVAELERRGWAVVAPR